MLSKILFGACLVLSIACLVLGNAVLSTKGEVASLEAENASLRADRQAIQDELDRQSELLVRWRNERDSTVTQYRRLRRTADEDAKDWAGGALPTSIVDRLHPDAD